MKYRWLIALLIPFLGIGCKDKKGPGPEPCLCYGNYYLYSDSSNLFTLPTAFTPDGNGKNDLFGIVSNAPLNFQPGSFLLTVTSGNDAIVFQTADPAREWNGGLAPSVQSGTKFYVKIKFITLAGIQVDDCTCIYLLVEDPSTNCVHTGSRTYYFEDQFDPATGTPPYITGENLCP